MSLVVATRNDDHGGNMRARTQVFLDALAAQCRRHGLAAELVIVEWNPPPDRPRLVDELAWPAGLPVRIIEVPAELHARYAHSDRLPLFQMIAKNVGIRRARAPYVLATNVDLIFSDRLMEEMAGRLQPGVMYRADRHDVGSSVPSGVDVREQLRWCEEHGLRIQSRDGTHDLRSGVFYSTRITLRVMPGYLREWLQGVFAKPLRVRFAELRGGEWARKVRPKIARFRVRLYTNACGDFTLMAREDWHRLRGYPELEIFSLHIDSLLLYIGHYAGLRERIFTGPAYHIEHEAGWKPAAEGRGLFERLADEGIPWITWDAYLEYIDGMAIARAPLQVNGEDWGLAQEELTEVSLGL